MTEYLGPCAHCRCSIYHDSVEDKRIYTTDDPDCRCELQEDLDVVAAIEKGLERNEEDWRKER